MTATLRAVLLLMVLGAGCLSPPRAGAQQAPPPESARGFVLEPNAPNPVERDTWIPFLLEQSLFDGRDTVRVTLRIYNVLRQLVAMPVTVDEQRRRGPPLDNVPHVDAGRRLAYWDGRDVDGRRAPSGIYYLELRVDDSRQIGKLIVINPERRRPRIFPWFGERESRP